MGHLALEQSKVVLKSQIYEFLDLNGKLARVVNLPVGPLAMTFVATIFGIIFFSFFSRFFSPPSSVSHRGNARIKNLFSKS